MTVAELIDIAEKFNKWLDDTSSEYKMTKGDLQEIIKHFLIGDTE